MKPKTARRLTEEDFLKGASYLSNALGVFVNLEDYSSSVRLAISAASDGGAFGGHIENAPQTSDTMSDQTHS